MRASPMRRRVRLASATVPVKKILLANTKRRTGLLPGIDSRNDAAGSNRQLLHDKTCRGRLRTHPSVRFSVLAGVSWRFESPASLRRGVPARSIRCRSSGTQ
jgi:hypothetical protein